MVVSGKQRGKGDLPYAVPHSQQKHPDEQHNIFLVSSFTVYDVSVCALLCSLPAQPVCRQW